MGWGGSAEDDVVGCTLSGGSRSIGLLRMSVSCVRILVYSCRCAELVGSSHLMVGGGPLRLG